MSMSKAVMFFAFAYFQLAKDCSQTDIGTQLIRALHYYNFRERRRRS